MDLTSSRTETGGSNPLSKMNMKMIMSVLIVLIVVFMGLGIWFMMNSEPTSQSKQDDFISDAKDNFKEEKKVKISGDGGVTKIVDGDFHLKVYGDTESYEMIAMGDNYYEVRDTECTKKDSGDKVDFDKSKINIMDFEEYYYEEEEKVGGVDAFKFYVKDSDGESSFIWFDTGSKLPVRRNKEGEIERISFDVDDISVPEGCNSN